MQDPRFVQRPLGLASTYVRAAVNGWVPPGEAWPRGGAGAAERGGLEPDNMLVRTALADLRFYQTGTGRPRSGTSPS